MLNDSFHNRVLLPPIFRWEIHFIERRFYYGKTERTDERRLRTERTEPAHPRDLLEACKPVLTLLQTAPYHLGEKQIKEYLLYLIREKKVSTSTVNKCYHALKFLYEKTLNRVWVMARIPRVKNLKQLPIVLDREEVESLFTATKNLKHRAILMLIYSSGLRLMEAAHLKVTDIDSQRMLVRIKQGKRLFL